MIKPPTTYPDAIVQTRKGSWTKPKMYAAQLNASRKVGLFHFHDGTCIRWHPLSATPDCKGKRDPDSQLETSFAAQGVNCRKTQQCNLRKLSLKQNTTQPVAQRQSLLFALQSVFQCALRLLPMMIETMADFNCHVPRDAIAWSTSSDGVGGRQRLFRGHIIPSKVLQGSEMRGHWLVPHVTLCLEHRHPIVPLWKESKPVLHFDSVRHLASLAPKIMAGSRRSGP